MRQSMRESSALSTPRDIEINVPSKTHIMYSFRCWSRLSKQIFQKPLFRLVTVHRKSTVSGCDVERVDFVRWYLSSFSIFFYVLFFQMFRKSPTFRIVYCFSSNNFFISLSLLLRKTNYISIKREFRQKALKEVVERRKLSRISKKEKILLLFSGNIDWFV